MAVVVESASAVWDGLVETLCSSSNFGEDVVSTDYGIMEKGSGCSMIVSWQSYQGNAMTYGNNQIGVHTFLLEYRVKDKGNTRTLMENIVLGVDVVLKAMRNDDTLQDTAHGIGEVRGSRKPGEAILTPGGETWLPVDFEVDVQVWD